MVEFFLPDNTYTYEMCKELEKYADVTIACKKGAARPGTGIQWKDFLYEGGRNKIAAAASYMKSLAMLDRELKNGGYDVVHAQYFRNLKAEMPIYLKNREKYGILVHTIHKLVPPEGKPEDKKLFGEFYNACSLIICHNEQSKKELAENFNVPLEKIRVMPMGGYSVDEGARRKFKEDGIARFLEFGQIRKYKGISLVIQAASMIPEEKRTGMHIDIIGKQYTKLDDTDYTAMARNLGVSETVSIRNEFVPDEEIPGIFGKTDVCLVPYTELQGSASLVLAYCYQKPVIASSLPLLREETGNGSTGLLFREGDPRALADAMLEAMEWTQEEAEKRQDSIKDLVNNKYNWEKSVKLLHSFYFQFLAQGKV